MDFIEKHWPGMALFAGAVCLLIGTAMLSIPWAFFVGGMELMIWAALVIIGRGGDES